MAERVKDIIFKAQVILDEGVRFKEGKLFLGILGFEYTFGSLMELAAQGDITRGINEFEANGKPSASILEYVYVNRTASPDDYAFSDGILPVYLRFQPDVGEPLAEAAKQNTAVGRLYNQQEIKLINPRVTVSGSVISRDPATGDVKYKPDTTNFTLPVQPEDKRQVTLSVQTGLFAFLAQVR